MWPRPFWMYFATEGTYDPTLSGSKIVLTRTSLSSYSGLRIVSQLHTIVEPNIELAAVSEPGTAARVLLGSCFWTTRPGRR